MSWMALLVGAMSNAILRRSASRFTSSITGNRPYASVPIEPLAFPRDLFFDGQRCVPKFLPKFLRGLPLAISNLPTVDEEVVLVGGLANAKGATTEVSEVHCGLRTVEIKIRRFSLR